MPRKSYSRGVVACAVAILAGIAGCGDENVTNVNIPGFEVNATFSGQVRSLPSDDPLAGATYTLLGTGISGTTDANGQLLIQGLSEGIHTVAVSATGHATVHVTFVVVVTNPSAGVHRPRIQRDVLAYETTASLQLQVFEGLGGSAAGDAALELDWMYPAAFSDHKIVDTTVPRSARTDSSGIVTLTSVPAMPLVAMAQPYDADGDGAPEFDTTALEVNLVAGEQLQRSLVLRTTAEAVTVVNTDMPASSSQPFNSPTPFVVFSTLMDTRANATTVTVSEFGGESFAANWSWGSEVRLDIALPTQSMLPGMLHAVVVSARSRSGRPVTFGRSFTWAAPTPPPGDGDCADFVTDLRLAGDADAIDFDTRFMHLQWTAVACAGGYNIFARDDHDNADWVLIQTEPSDFETGVIKSPVTLPAEFDRFLADALQTPFAGTTVEFSVVPLRAIDPTPGAPHATLSVNDETAPKIVSLDQAGVGASGDTDQMSFVVEFSEYLSDNVGTPTIEVQEAGGDPQFRLDPATAEWTWDAGLASGRATFTVQMGQDATGDLLRVVFTNLTDLSGNVVPGTTVTVWHEIDAASFFDFESSPQGWTRVGDAWEWGSPLLGPRSGFSGHRVWALKLDERYGPNWDARLKSPPVFVHPQASQLSMFVWSALATGEVVRVLVEEDGTETLIANLIQFNAFWREFTFPLDAFAGRTVRIIFEFESDSLSEADGIYIDDVCVSCPP